MVKKTKMIASVICAVCAIAVFLALWIQADRSRKDEGREAALAGRNAAIAEMSGLYKEIEKTVFSLDDSFSLESAEELYPPLIYENAGGANISFYQYAYKNIDLGGEGAAIHKIINPKEAKSSRSCNVGAFDAIIYDKGNKSYLWFNPIEGMLFVFEYDPMAVPDEEIIKMAESIRGVEQIH